jgi:hypothetical protein
MDMITAFEARDEDASNTSPQLSAFEQAEAAQLGTEFGLRMLLTLAEAEARAARALLASHRRHCICHAETLVAEEIEAGRDAPSPSGFVAALAAA